MTNSTKLMVSGTATGNTCPHKVGWYGYARFWIFKRKYFMCSICGDFRAIERWRIA